MTSDALGTGGSERRCATIARIVRIPRGASIAQPAEARRQPALVAGLARRVIDERGDGAGLQPWHAELAPGRGDEPGERPLVRRRALERIVELDLDLEEIDELLVGFEQREVELGRADQAQLGVEW